MSRAVEEALGFRADAAEAELGYVAAQWQDTDTHTVERTRRFALRAARAAANAPIAQGTVQAARSFRVGELTADEFIRVVLDHVYGPRAQQPAEARKCERCYQPLTFADGHARCLNVLCREWDRPLDTECPGSGPGRRV